MSQRFDEGDKVQPKWARMFPLSSLAPSQRRPRNFVNIERPETGERLRLEEQEEPDFETHQKFSQGGSCHAAIERLCLAANDMSLTAVHFLHKQPVEERVHETERKQKDFIIL